MVAKDKDSASLKERRKRIRSVGSEERRGYIRTESSVSLTLDMKDAGIDKMITAVTRNVSATGLMVEADREVPVGSEGKMGIETPGSHNPVHATGKVVWCSPAEDGGKFNYGIEITSIEEDNKNTFLKFLCDAIYKVSNI